MSARASALARARARVPIAEAERVMLHSAASAYLREVFMALKNQLSTQQLRTSRGASLSSSSRGHGGRRAGKKSSGSVDGADATVDVALRGAQFARMLAHLTVHLRPTAEFAPAELLNEVLQSVVLLAARRLCAVEVKMVDAKNMARSVGMVLPTACAEGLSVSCWCSSRAQSTPSRADSDVPPAAEMPHKSCKLPFGMRHGWHDR